MARALREVARATPLAALDGAATPTELHFVRSHFGTPATDAQPWSVELAGAVARPYALSLADLREAARHTVLAVLECAGHRRCELDPPVAGIAWGVGAVSQAEWTGARLRDLLARAEPDAGAAEVALHGAETFSRAVPLATALEADTLVAWAIGGKPIPPDLGGPVRAVVPGRYAVDSVKWLRRIEVRTEPFRGPFQTDDYRIFGADSVPEGAPLGDLPVSSLVTWPEDGGAVPVGPLAVRGVAWGGAGGVVAVSVWVDDREQTPATLAPPAGRYAFAPWEATVEVESGDHAISACAVDAASAAQPDQPLWNRRGYANSSVHRVWIRAGS